MIVPGIRLDLERVVASPQQLGIAHENRQRAIKAGDNKLAAVEIGKLLQHVGSEVLFLARPKIRKMVRLVEDEQLRGFN